MAKRQCDDANAGIVVSQSKIPGVRSWTTEGLGQGQMVFSKSAIAHPHSNIGNDTEELVR